MTGIHCCAVVTLYWKNTFYSVSWAAIATTIHHLRVPEELLPEEGLNNEWVHDHL